MPRALIASISMRLRPELIQLHELLELLALGQFVGQVRAGRQGFGCRDEDVARIGRHGRLGLLRRFFDKGGCRRRLDDRNRRLGGAAAAPLPDDAS